MHVVYRIEHLPSKRWYVGVANLPMWEGGYMGSGKHWKRIVHKHPRIEFSREIICTFDEADDAFDFEAKVVTVNQIKVDSLCCNLKPGGRGKSMPGQLRSTNYQENVSAAMKKLAARRKEQGLPGANTGRTFDAMWCQKLGDTSRGTHWWVNPNGQNIRSKDQPGPEWKKGRKYV